MLFKGWRRSVGGLLVAFAFQAGAAAAAAPDSARLGRAKDYIADEQWTRAIAELRTVVRRPEGEVARRSALLAGAQPEPGGRFGGGHHDDPSARARISRRACGSSLRARSGWTSRCTCSAATCSGGRPCRRAPPAPAAAAAPRAPSVPPAAPAPPVCATPPRCRAAPPPPPPPGHRPLPPPAAPHVAPAFPTPPVPPAAWLPEDYRPDADIRIQALDRLMRDRCDSRDSDPEADRARERERARGEPGLVRAGPVRASPKRDETVVQVAMLASEPVRIAAVRELGRFGGPDVVTGPDARLREQRPGGEDAGGDVARRACRANGAAPDRQGREGPARSRQPRS